MDSDIEGLTFAEGIKHPKCRARCGHQLVETDRRRSTLQDARANNVHLFLLAFVLRLQRDLLFASVFVERRTAKVVEHERSPRTKYLDALLRESFVALSEIRDAAVRSIRKAQRDDDRIRVNNLARSRTDRFRENRNRRRSGQILNQVDEMADLTDDPAATLFSILHPVFVWNTTSVHAIKHRERRIDIVEELFCTLRQRRETAIEADHQFRGRTSRRFQH